MEAGKHYHIYTHANGFENLFQSAENYWVLFKAVRTFYSARGRYICLVFDAQPSPLPYSNKNRGGTNCHFFFKPSIKSIKFRIKRPIKPPRFRKPWRFRWRFKWRFRWKFRKRNRKKNLATIQQPLQRLHQGVQ